jgi:tetratricopeptide (TPR) repeat protein
MTVGAAISLYEDAINNLLLKQNGSARSRNDDDELKVMKVLVARDQIEHQMSGQPITVDILTRIAQQDRRLKESVKAINNIVGRSTLTSWRESRQPPESAWWWSLELQETEPWYKLALTIFLWVCIAMALSFIVELVRRFVSSGVDIPSTILQGWLGFLVGSTIFQFAKQVAEVRSRQSNEKSASSKLRTRLILAVIIVLTALAMEYFRPTVAYYYSNKGVYERAGGQPSSPIESYQRSINLKPDDAIAHYNLASAYEAILEYEKAESEYLSAIRWNDQLYIVYPRLARLYILRRKDPANALRLIDTGLEKLDLLEQDERALAALNDQERQEIKKSWQRTRFALWKDRGWAELNLEHYGQAENALKKALEIRKDGAAALCLLAQVLEQKARKLETQPGKAQSLKAQKAKDEAIFQWEQCIANSNLQKDEIEPDWLSLAHERTEPEEESQKEKKND